MSRGSSGDSRGDDGGGSEYVSAPPDDEIPAVEPMSASEPFALPKSEIMFANLGESKGYLDMRNTGAIDSFPAAEN